jgi:hypothetical protein
MMDKKETNIRVSGDVSGQLAIGDNITQKQTIETHQSQVSQVDMDALRQMLADLKVKVEAEAPDDKKDAALERVSELEEAITAEKPDLTTMEYVKGWFGKNLPKLAGAVSSVIINPLVGTLVEASGELIAEEFKRRFSKE